MIYLLSTVAGLLAVVVAGTAGLLYLATRDAASTEDDDDEDDDILSDLIDSLPIYVSPVPPFEIVCLGPKGQHDEYPIRPGLRQSFVDLLEASWNLPEREPGATL